MKSLEVDIDVVSVFFCFFWLVIELFLCEYIGRVRDETGVDVYIYRYIA